MVYYKKQSMLYIYLKKLKYFLHKNNKLEYTILYNNKFKYYIHKLKILLENNIKLNNIKYLDLIDIYKYEIINLPKDINISTMCASCKLNNKINLYNIENYLKINDNNVITKKISNNNIETLLPIIKSKRKKKNQKNSNKKNFYNQITIVMRVTNGMYKNLIEEPKINMKLFKNGSIQMSGCKNVYNINIALNKIINIIKKSCNTEHSFIDDIKNDICINNFKIDMINSNYKYYIQIDRIKLHELLIKKKIRSTYEPCIKACVIIKIPNINPNINSNINNKDISVFIFQKGNIIINSAKSCEQIISTYNYINDILYTYKDDIIKKDEQLEINDIFKYYNQIMIDVKYGLIPLERILPPKYINYSI